MSEIYQPPMPGYGPQGYPPQMMGQYSQPPYQPSYDPRLDPRYDGPSTQQHRTSAWAVILIVMVVIGLIVLVGGLIWWSQQKKNECTSDSECTNSGEFCISTTSGATGHCERLEHHCKSSSDCPFDGTAQLICSSKNICIFSS